VVDGCPARLALTTADIQVELDRRRPGQSKLTSQRQEADTVEILSGVHEGLTLGTPIALLIRNTDARPRDYGEMADKYRPSHADYTTQAKYGIRDHRGGGRASARETAARVAAGAIARKWLALSHGVEILAWVERVQALAATVDHLTVRREDIEANPVRCPDQVRAAELSAVIVAAGLAGDSLGGVVAAVARGVPAGWGEPVFDRLEADLARAMLSIPACKGFESGSGFAGTLLTGRAHNDAFVPVDGQVRTRSNNSGGIQGGISNGEAITLRAAFKPTATIMHEQDTVTVDVQATTITGRGRHDACVLPRAAPIVEAMMALVLCDHALRQRALGSAPGSVL
jgi:chorismate synthase